MNDTNAGPEPLLPCLPGPAIARKYGPQVEAYGLQCWNACDEQVAGPLRERLDETERALMLSGMEAKALRERVAELEGIKPEIHPRPPECGGLLRYGLRWNGPTSPLSVPMPDGYWTPWHLAAERVAELEQMVEQLGERPHKSAWLAMLAECRARGEELSRLRAENEAQRECWNALRSMSRHVERMREAGLFECDDIGPEHWARELLAARAAREG